MSEFERWISLDHVKSALEHRECPGWAGRDYIKVKLIIDDEDLLKVLKENNET